MLMLAGTYRDVIVLAFSAIGAREKQQSKDAKSSGDAVWMRCSDISGAHLCDIGSAASQRHTLAATITLNHNAAVAVTPNHNAATLLHLPDIKRHTHSCTVS